MKTMKSFDTPSGRLGYAHAESAAAGTTEAVLLPGLGEAPTVHLVPGATSSGTVETTISTPDKVKAGTAVWVAWADGAVSTATMKTLTSPATAIRLVVTGTCDWEVLA